jgi:glycosyltransferase involved in cell wall biosynthesis
MIDYEESVRVFQQATSYVVSATERREVAAAQSVIVGIPAYNEEVGIGSVILEAEQHADEVVVVDDGSQDTTADVARYAGATILQHESNQGKGAAIQTLMRSVLPSDFDTLVFLDGDGQHAPADIPQVIEPVLEDEADLVVGSRYLEDGGCDETPRYRRFGQRVLDLLTLGSASAGVTDSQSGFRALSPSAVEQLSLSSTSFGVESEMISEAVDKGLEIEEQAIEVRYERIDGQTQNSLRHGLTVVLFILQQVRDRHLLLFFGVPGLLFALVGGLYVLDGNLLYVNAGKFLNVKALNSGFYVFIGMLSIFTGFILNSISNMN